MKLNEMSDEELAHWITIAKEAKQMYSFPNEGPSTQRPGATTTVAYTRYTLLELAHEAARRLAVKSDWIPRPKVDVSHSTEGSFLTVNGVSVVRIGWQTPSVCVTLEKALGMEGDIL